MPLLKLPISVGADCWICAEAYIGPGISVGDRSIVAARAVVVKPIPPNSIFGGNPACQIGRTDTSAALDPDPS
ncbi:DapH/DapD/GlmU-related protein [Tropicimonas sediminicola]|uniref:DapH/DapD/GlmU-related protein n=1 Tax=Tropicimonas sediminicola TaxID=1031541 RepID=UPI001FEAE83D|nr:hypothetical protein [Tropicimonas sediminicola]